MKKPGSKQVLPPGSDNFLIILCWLKRIPDQVQTSRYGS